MRIVAIAIAKNEADIIEAFVRHALAIAERLIVLDNGSSDGTLEILRALRDEGLAIDIVEDPLPGKRQGEQMTMLMHEFAVRRYAADWVLVLDADEFLVLNGCSLVTSKTPTNAPIALTWRTYVPVASDPTSELNPVRRIKNRLRQENWTWTKILVPGKLAALSDARIMPGNHEFRVGERVCETVSAEGALLAHFPIRSVSQFFAKVAIGHLQYLVVPDRPGDWGWHYRDAFEQLKQNPAAMAAGLTRAALQYACPDQMSVCTETLLDPIAYLGKPQQYTRKIDEHWRALQIIATYAEDLANRYGILVAGTNSHGILSEEKYAETLAELHRKLEQQADVLREEGVASRLRDEQFKRMAANVEAQNAELNKVRQDLVERDRELHKLNGQIHGLGAACDHAQQQALALMEAYRSARKSWTWRTGRLLIGPAEWLRKKVRTARFAKKRKTVRQSSDAS